MTSVVRSASGDASSAPAMRAANAARQIRAPAPGRHAGQRPRPPLRPLASRPRRRRAPSAARAERARHARDSAAARARRGRRARRAARGGSPHATANAERAPRACAASAALMRVQRRAADGLVAAAQLVDELRRGRAPAADVGHERGEVVQVVDGAVRDERRPRRRSSRARSARTYSTTARTLSTGVSGMMPWPRLKMCPGRPPAASRTRWACLTATSRVASSAHGSMLPWTARS